MPSFFNQLVNFFTSESPVTRVLVTLLLLILGHLAVKITGKILKRFWIERHQELNRKDVEERYETIKYLSYFLDAVVIVLALMYMNTSLTSNLSSSMAEILPNLLSSGLIATLGFIAVNLTVRGSKDVLKALGAGKYFREIGLSSAAAGFFSILLKGFLYLLILQIALAELGIGETFISKMITASSWAAAFLTAGLLFYGFKDLFQNFAAGIYLQNSRQVRPGEKINLDGKDAEIRDISLFSTSLNTKDGYTKISPNQKIASSTISVRRTKRDIETLDDIKNYFVAQNPSYCGPASLEMALEIFGYRFSQEKIGEKAGCEVGEGTEVEEMLETAEELTNRKVRAAWVEYDKITDLSDEFKTWFNNGALIIPNFYKPEIFPDATTGHYVLSVGVEGDEILIADPNPETGGVYYVDHERLRKAMAEFGHKRGYIVLAPEGTTAHWRIKNDLIYSDKNYYDQISKSLESRLRKILRQGRILSEATPEKVDEYIEKWRNEEKITRLWKPEEENSQEENKE